MPSSLPPVDIPRLIDGSKVIWFQILIFMVLRGGELIRRNWSDLFLAVAIPAALSALVLLVMALLADRTGPVVKDAIAH